MKEKNVAILTISREGREIALLLRDELPGVTLYSTVEAEGFHTMASLREGCRELIGEYSALIFCSALGICVRTVGDLLQDKHIDPAILCIDTTGHYVIPVASGHVGGANDLARRIAHILGGEAVVTTQSDRRGLWALDTLGEEQGWRTELLGTTMNHAIALFVERHRVALLIETRSEGTALLERTRPEWVTLFHKAEEIRPRDFDLLINVGCRYHAEIDLPQLCYRPPLLHLGVGCRRMADPTGVTDHILSEVRAGGFSPLSIADLSSIELKRDEPILEALAERLGVPVRYYDSETLDGVSVPHPSERVGEATGSASVSEAAALTSSGGSELVIEKQKGKLSEGSDFTFALAIERKGVMRGHIEFVGAGPGDPDLISVRGRHFLETADLILYAGSLVPVALTECAKEGAVVRSSAGMALGEQIALMKSFYDRGALVVRLHTGDPCIYGAIEEQMAILDEEGMEYHITPGISSFQAAAAELQSEFTIPERVQTIILTRGSGRTPVPEREQLSRLAASQSTMCIYLSASIAEEVERELLTHYPPTTPVAVCYKLTHPEQRIYRGELSDLARIVREQGLKLTTMIVVGEAIGNREGLSRLYHKDFKHLFRP